MTMLYIVLADGIVDFLFGVSIREKMNNGSIDSIKYDQSAVSAFNNSATCTVVLLIREGVVVVVAPLCWWSSVHSSRRVSSASFLYHR